MAGILDWLTEGLGSDMGGSSMGSGSTPPSSPPPMPSAGRTVFPPLPMRSMTGDSPSLPQPPQPTPPASPPPGDSPPMPPMTAGDSPSNGPSLPQPPQPSVPMPMPRPPGADANQGPLTGGNPAIPPAVAPDSGTGMPLGPPTSLAPPMPNAVGSAAGANSFLGRALGLNRNSERTMSGSLASGLKAVGENVHKPGLAAFAGSAGSAMEGGNTAENKVSDEQQKYLTQAIAAAQAGNTQALNIARTRLALAQAKTEEAKDGKTDKASVVNSQEQLYLRGLGAVNQDGTVKASLAQLRSLQAQFGPDSKEAKAAMTAHNELIENTKKKVFSTLGVNEKEAAKIGKQAGFAADNPVPAAGLTKEKFDALPVGAYFINPKDQRLLIKQPPAGANPATPAQSSAPAAPPPVTAPAGSAADREDDE